MIVVIISNEINHRVSESSQTKVSFRKRSFLTRVRLFAWLFFESRGVSKEVRVGGHHVNTNISANHPKMVRSAIFYIDIIIQTIFLCEPTYTTYQNINIWVNSKILNTKKQRFSSYSILLVSWICELLLQLCLRK